MSEKAFDEWLASLRPVDRYNFDNEGRGYKKDCSTMMRLAFNAGLQAALSQPAPEHPVITAAIQWFCERQINDWDEADLAKAVATHAGDWPGCDECDHECDEPCMPCTVAEVHASIDNRIAQLVHDGKLYAYEGYAPPAGWTPNVTPAPRRKAKPAPQGAAEVMWLADSMKNSAKHGSREKRLSDRAALEQAVTAIMQERDALKARVAELEGDVARAERFAKIGCAVERASASLPEGYGLRIELETCAGSIYLTNDSGNEIELPDDSSEPFGSQIETAIDAAIAAAKEPSND